VLTLFVVSERLYGAIEEAGVHGCVGRMEGKVEYLRTDLDVWHYDDKVFRWTCAAASSTAELNA